MQSWLTALHANQTSESRSCLRGRILVRSAWGVSPMQLSQGSSVTHLVPSNACFCGGCSCSLCLRKSWSSGSSDRPCRAMGVCSDVSSLMSLQVPFSFACQDLNAESPKSRVARRELTAAVRAGSSLPVSQWLQDPSKPPAPVSCAFVPGVSLLSVSPLPCEVSSRWRVLASACRGE